MNRILALFLVAVIVGCDFGRDSDPASLAGDWQASTKAPTFGAVQVSVGETCYSSGCVPSIVTPEEVAYDVTLTLRDDGTYRVRRAASYFAVRGESADTLASFDYDYSGTFDASSDSLLLTGERSAPALRYQVSRDSLILRVAYADAPLVQIPQECNPGRAAPPECGGAFERVQP